MAQNKSGGDRVGETVDEPSRYIVKEHPRARYVHLKLTRQGDLEVVVPRGYDRRGIPEVIAAKRIWLERTRAQLHQQMARLPADHFERRPTQVRLRSLNEIYAVAYQATADARLTVSGSQQRVSVHGPIHDVTVCTRGLNRWLHAKAREVLMPWLCYVSRDLALPYTRAIIRGQRGRWGSCSAQGVISLNRKLLFLPRAQVYYLLVHELCHTRHLNHSVRYWKLVERKLPDYRRYEAQLREAWRYVPRWAGD